MPTTTKTHFDILHAELFIDGKIIQFVSPGTPVLMLDKDVLYVLKDLPKPTVLSFCSRHFLKIDSVGMTTVNSSFFDDLILLRR